MKREHSYILGIASLLCFCLWSCTSTLIWRVEKIDKVEVKAEVKKDTVKTDVKKKRIDVIRDTENGEWNRLMPPIK